MLTNGRSLWAGLLLVALLTGSTTAFGEPRPNPPALHTYTAGPDTIRIATERGISVGLATDLYEWTNDFSAIANELESTFPDSYAGERIDDDLKGAEINFIGSVPARAVSLVKSLPVTVRLGTQEGPSRKDLQNRMETLYHQVLKTPGVADAVGSFDPKKDSISLGAEPSKSLSEPEQQALLTTLQSLAKPVEPDVTVSVSLVPNAGDVEVDMRGGAYLDYAGDPYCTAGFTVRNVSTGQLGLSTASHCTVDPHDGTDIDTFRFYNHGSSNYTNVNRIAYSNTVDLAWFNRGSYDVTKGFYFDYYSYRIATGAVDPSVNAPTGNFGRTNGAHTDRRVLSRDICSYGYCGLTALTTYVTSGGDSGGPWFYNGVAHGIHHGRIVWLADGQYRSAFAPVADLGNAFGVIVYR